MRDRGIRGLVIIDRTFGEIITLRVQNNRIESLDLPGRFKLLKCVSFASYILLNKLNLIVPDPL